MFPLLVMAARNKAPPARGPVAPEPPTVPPSTVAPSTAAPATSQILAALPSLVMIPSLFILFVASVTLTAVNAAFNVIFHEDRTVQETFQQWRRVLWMSKAAHIVEASSAEQAYRMTRTHHEAAVTATSTPMMSPVELYGSAAFFRGITAPSSPPISSSGGVVATDVAVVGLPAGGGSGVGAPAVRTDSLSATPTPAAAAPVNAATSTVAETAVYHDENPPAAVPAPVVAEALTNTMEAVRLVSQRIVFEFHPNYIIVCAGKAFAMLVYIQYHFGSIDGGWRRFCVCGAANIFSGLLTPVWEYIMLWLLPLDLDRANPVVVKEEEERADSVFIVELLLRIGSLELDDLPTVLMQGSSFVAFSAVLVPLLGFFCVVGWVRFLWIYAPIWVVYVMLRHVYYKGAGSLPSSTARNTAAVVGMSSELLKAFLMKALTLFVLLFTVQSGFLLGLAWMEALSYDYSLEYITKHEVHLRLSAFATPFQRACLLSQLFL